MQTSFFRENFFKIIERQIIDNTITFEMENEVSLVLKAYDFSAWKINSSLDSHNVHSLLTHEKSLTELKSKHKNPFGICVTTVKDVLIASQFANFLYIPGEFCRQSDVLDAAKNSKIPIVVEKGIFLSPNDLKRITEKIKGSDFSLVECGSSNGYSDSILDPRSLYLLKKSSGYFGVSLSDLLASEGIQYEHRPHWLNNREFLNSFILTSSAFGVSFFVIKNYGNGKLNALDILERL